MSITTIPTPAALIAAAIAGRRLLRLRYDGRERVVEPHVLGVMGREVLALSAWQVRGESASGQSQGWKTLPLARIGDVALLDERFAAARPDYLRDDALFREILAQL